MSGDHNMNQFTYGKTISGGGLNMTHEEHMKHDAYRNEMLRNQVKDVEEQEKYKNQLYIGLGAYHFNDPPPVVGYWVLPCQNTQYKTMFAGYRKPVWFHRMTMKWLLGWTWKDVK